MSDALLLVLPSYLLFFLPATGCWGCWDSEASHTHTFVKELHNKGTAPVPVNFPQKAASNSNNGPCSIQRTSSRGQRYLAHATPKDSAIAQ